MIKPELLQLVWAVINSVEEDNLFEESLEKLQFFFPDGLLLSALDLIDRENVIKCNTPWGTTHFQVLGSASTPSYTVFPSLPSSPSMPAYCTCPAFADNVLKLEAQIMCEHVLAAHLAQRLGKCVERSLTADDLASIIMRQYS